MRRIFSLILALMAVQMMWAAPYTVTNTSDDVEEEGSLRWACKTATANDTIVFKFSTKGDKTIHISSYLTTNASIDGSTWADSIIIDGYDEENGTKAIFGGLNGTGPFVKNIIVQNCYNGITPSSGTILYDCIARDCTRNGYDCSSGTVSFIRCQSLNNGYSGIFLYGSALGLFENCIVFDNAEYGIRGGGILRNCEIYNNKIGLYLPSATTCDEIKECVISGNDSIGVLTESIVELFSDNIIGLSADQKDINPNGYGIYSRAGITNFVNNVVSGNKKDGIFDQSRIGIEYMTDNYIGTNKYFDENPMLGNIGNGYVPKSDPYGDIKDFSHNYFGNNGEYGIYLNTSSYHATFNECYFGITPDGRPMPNGKGGLKVGFYYLTLKDCHIGYNEGVGLEYTRSGGDLKVSGGKIVYNKKDGVLLDLNTNYLEVADVIFDSNGKSAITLNTQHSFTSLLSNNKFLNTVRPYPAFETTDPYPVPEFTSCKMTEKTIVIEGKIDTAAKAKIT